MQSTQYFECVLWSCVLLSHHGLDSHQFLHDCFESWEGNFHSNDSFPSRPNTTVRLRMTARSKDDVSVRAPPKVGHKLLPAAGVPTSIGSAHLALSPSLSSRLLGREEVDSTLLLHSLRAFSHLLGLWSPSFGQPSSLASSCSFLALSLYYLSHGWSPPSWFDPACLVSLWDSGQSLMYLP